MMYRLLNKTFWLLIFVALMIPRWFASGDTHADIPPGDASISIKFDNPIKANTIGEFVEKILEIVVTIGVPIVAIFIIYSGFLFVQARGNSEKLKEAKNTFLYTIIGAAILLGAWVLAQAIGGTIEQLR